MFSTSAKAVLIILNIIIFVGGAALVAIGLLMRFDTGFLDGDAIGLLNRITYNNMPLGVALEVLAYGSIGFGVVIMILAFFGLCGAWKEIRGCVYCYLTAVMFVILMEAALAGIWIAIRGRNGEWLRGSLLSELKDYAGPTATDDVSQGWNDLFMEAHCCGVNDQFKDGGTNSDFTELPTTWTSLTDKVPATCCQGVDSGSIASYENSASCTNTPSNFYTEGCYSTISYDINLYSLISIAICAALGLAQVMGFAAACVAISKKKRTITPVTSRRMSESGARPPPYIAIEKFKRNRNRKKELNSSY